MTDSSNLPPLKPLHSDTSLDPGKLAKMEKIATEILQATLLAGEHCLKTRPDGTILDGHHRIYVLRRRSVNVDILPREVIAKD